MLHTRILLRNCCTKSTFLLLFLVSVEDFCDDRADGIYPHPEDCTQFIQCSQGVEYFNQCPECTYYNPEIQVQWHCVCVIQCV